MMQAPIPIAQAPGRLDSYSFQRPGGLTPRASSSFSNFVGSASYKEPMAVSFGKDVSEYVS